MGLRGQAEKEQVTIQRAPERVPFSYGDQIMEDSKSITRRELLARSGQVAAGIGLAAALGNLPAGAAEKPTVKPRRTIGANDRIVVACIGTGGMGRANLNGFLDHQEVDVAAVCDLDTRHMAEAAKMVQDKRGKRPAEIKDFRRVLEMNDIDAVVISTTDHWHALPFIYACQTGKDVFVEKPISHNITEGQQMVNAARRYKAVTQVNTWQRSTQLFFDAIVYVRSGTWQDNRRSVVEDGQRPDGQKDTLLAARGTGLRLLGRPGCLRTVPRKPVPLQLPVVFQLRRRYDGRLGRAYD